jgi:hypothetical protein
MTILMQHSAGSVFGPWAHVNLRNSLVRGRLINISLLKTFLEHNPFEGRVSESDAIRALRYRGIHPGAHVVAHEARYAR